MPARNWLIRLEDMLTASEKILRYTGELADLEAFTDDEKTVYAALHGVQTIGEAARHVPDEVQARYPDSAWAEMRGMRNILVHDCSKIDLEVVWLTIRDDLPPTIARLREILDAEQTAPTDPAG